MVNKEAKVELAREYFLQGYSCSQAVAAAFSEEMGMDVKDVLRLTSGLGGGVGGLRQVCGAVTGMCVVAGKLLGYDESDARPEKQHLYALEQHMAARFTEAFSTLNCGELLRSNGVFVKNEVSERTPEYYRTRPCVRFVEACAGYLADTLSEENP